MPELDFLLLRLVHLGSFDVENSGGLNVTPLVAVRVH